MNRLFITLIILQLFSAGQPHASAAEPADSITHGRTLREISVKTTAPRRVVRVGTDGNILIDSRHLGEQPSLMGSNDPIALIRSLPAVATANELQAAVSIRGGSAGDNLFETDGIRIVNPMHMLGLYSAFNPSFYRSYSFRPGRTDAVTPNCTGGYFTADSGSEPDTITSGAFAAGLIESHGTVRVPLGKGKSSLAAGVRRTYLQLLFPDILKLGTSTLRYGFTDVNLAMAFRPGDRDRLNFSVFYNRDRMKADNSKNGTKHGRFGWSNLCGGIGWTHGDILTTASISHYENSFELDEGGRALDLPSSLTQATLRTVIPHGDFNFGSDFSYRHSSGQRNRALAGNGDTATPTDALEWNLAATWHKELFRRMVLETGLRMTLYHCGGFNTAALQPRLNVTYTFARGFNLFAAYGRHMKFDKLVEETTGGLPADFRINADRLNKPHDVHSAEIGISGFIPAAELNFIVEGYYKRAFHSTEFKGSLLSLANKGYNPMTDILDGDGYSAGLSLTLMRHWGRLRGRVGYNLGLSRVRFAEYGDGYIPSAHDRLHDLSATLSWSVTGGITFAASFTHATGTPYTKARYGYMISENLICEYFPHNSSRLPAYNRLDLSADWVFLRRKSMKHSLNISVYNALASRNVLFLYTSYSVKEGIRQEESTMKAVIPSVTYKFEF